MFVSLLKEYPVGGILIWKTTKPPALKNLEITDNSNKTYQVLLDGQQRLTTLYLIITGKIPPYYKDEEITFDPRDLAFNLETNQFNYWNNSMIDNPRWQLVSDCFEPGKIKPWKIAEIVLRLIKLH